MNTSLKLVAVGILAAFACVAGAQGTNAGGSGQQSGSGQSAKPADPGQSGAGKGAGNAQGKQKSHVNEKGKGNGGGRNPSSGKQGKASSTAN